MLKLMLTIGTGCLALAIASLPSSVKAETRQLQIGETARLAFCLPDFVAKDKGFYSKHGVDPVVTYVGNPAAAVQQVVGSAFDLAFTTMEVAIRAKDQGAPISMVGSTLLLFPHSIVSDSKVKNPPDLKDRRVMMSVPKDAISAHFLDWLSKGGVSEKEIEIVYDGATPNRYAALTSGTVAVTVLAQPFDLRATAAGYNKLMSVAEMMPDVGFYAIVATNSWIEKNATDLDKYISALREATEWLYDPANRDEAIRILATNIQSDRETAEQIFDLYVGDIKIFNKDIKVPLSAVEGNLTVLRRAGAAGAEASTYVDANYAR
ncbi:ABC transporter substrate-binding protein [Aminobacter sp. Piv2-1]|uniref:ABC transporter substrate-binding protein n=1 Tax=Aminobacter sp. Piv2-1 TaxID=3031122 RepID=UPI0030A79BF2